MKNRPYLFYLIVVGFVILGKILFTQSTNDSLVFILKPLSAIIAFVLDSDFIYTNSAGYYFESLNITIDKSCSGINFWIISFAMFSISIGNTLKTNAIKLKALIIVFAATYLFTLFANTSRILTAVFISNKIELNYSWLHQAQGVFIYLSLLILAYTVFNFLRSKFQNHYAKLT